MTDNSSLTDYFNKLARLPLLTEAEEKELFVKAKAGDEKARETIIVRNIRLVIKPARDYVKTGIPLGDLVQEGTKGLVKACDHFDLSKGVRFSTYAVQWIQQHIGRYAKKHVKNVFVPEHIMNLARRLHRTMREEENAGRQPNHAELAKLVNEKYKMKVTAQQVKETLEFCQGETSIFAKVGSDGETEFGELLHDDNAKIPSSEVGSAMAAECLAKAIASLTDRERIILTLRHGVFGRKMTVKEVASEFHVTEDEIRAAASEALKQMGRDPSELPETKAA